MIRAVLYTRVSSDKQSDKYSLPMQLQRMKSYCEFSCMEIVAHEEDVAISGYKTKRDGYQNVLRMVKDGLVDAVVVFSLSRFARNTRATLEALDLLEKYGVQFHSLTERFDTSTAFGRAMTTILAALNQLERDQGGERTKYTLDYKKELGECIGTPPFGKTVVGRTETFGGTLVDNYDEQQVILLILELKNKGMSYQKIAETLTCNEVKNRNSTKWYSSQVFNIYKNNYGKSPTTV